MAGASVSNKPGYAILIFCHPYTVLLMGIYASISKSEAAAATFMQQWVAQRIFRSDALPDGIFGLLGELC